MVDGRVVSKLRGGTPVFQAETGRWQRVKGEGSVCKRGSSGEVYAYSARRSVVVVGGGCNLYINQYI